MASTKKRKSLDRAAIQAVIAFVIDGEASNHVREWFAAEHPELDAEAHLVAVDEFFREVSKQDADIARGWALEALRDLFRSMKKIGDFHGAHQVLKSYIKAVADGAGAAAKTDQTEGEQGRPAWLKVLEGKAAIGQNRRK